MQSPDEVANFWFGKLQEDLAFAAPEIHGLHIHRRFSDAVNNYAYDLRDAIEELPTVTIHADPMHPNTYDWPAVSLKAVIALIDGPEDDDATDAG